MVELHWKFSVWFDYFKDALICLDESLKINEKGRTKTPTKMKITLDYCSNLIMQSGNALKWTLFSTKQNREKKCIVLMSVNLSNSENKKQPITSIVFIVFNKLFWFCFIVLTH